MPDGRLFLPRTTALVEEATALAPTATAVDADATIVAIDDTRVRLHTRSEGPGLLVLSDVNYPGWRATVDGRPSPVYQTDYLLRGTVIPAGEHDVEFVFWPWSFAIGSAVSMLALLTRAATSFV